jgi:hypothetical protein
MRRHRHDARAPHKGAGPALNDLLAGHVDLRIIKETGVTPE